MIIEFALHSAVHSLTNTCIIYAYLAGCVFVCVHAYVTLRDWQQDMSCKQVDDEVLARKDNYSDRKQTTQVLLKEHIKYDTRLSRTIMFERMLNNEPFKN